MPEASLPWMLSLCAQTASEGNTFMQRAPSIGGEAFQTQPRTDTDE